MISAPIPGILLTGPCPPSAEPAAFRPPSRPGGIRAQDNLRVGILSLTLSSRSTSSSTVRARPRLAGKGPAPGRELYRPGFPGSEGKPARGTKLVILVPEGGPAGPASALDRILKLSDRKRPKLRTTVAVLNRPRSPRRAPRIRGPGGSPSGSPRRRSRSRRSPPSRSTSCGWSRPGRPDPSPGRPTGFALPDP